PSGPRDLFAGPESGPEPPFPLKLSGEVIKGFGRGSKELGIPTANIPLSGLSVGGNEDLESGIYFGYAGLNIPHPDASSTSSSSADAGIAPDPSSTTSSPPNTSVYPMVMSIGWNPFYKNLVRSVEVHIMHSFPSDFYSAHMNLVILGFIRPEYDYVSKESLIEDIRTDVEVARRSLEREGWSGWSGDGFLREF
ncbi:riboflavin kinase, partial [Aulographum hederae CBS 113979]